MTARIHIWFGVFIVCMSGWPFSPTSIYITTASATTATTTTTTTTTTTAITFTYSNDKCLNMRNGSFYN